MARLHNLLGLAATPAQIAAWQEAVQRSGLGTSEATREALRMFCAQHGVEFPAWNPRERKSVWAAKKEQKQGERNE